MGPILDAMELATPPEPERLPDRADPSPERIGAGLMLRCIAPARQREQLGRHDIERESKVVEMAAATGAAAPSRENSSNSFSPLALDKCTGL